MIKNITILVLASMSLASCGFQWEVPMNQRDPYESYNRKMFQYNEKVYTYLTPVADGYNYVVPNGVKNGIYNVFQNLFEPSRVANDLFQGQWSYAKDDSLRFLTNTTVGLVGIFDFAQKFDLPMREDQKFATTLHKWGVYKKGYASPYIVWPLVGPGTAESPANIVDTAFNPLSYLFLSPGVTIFTSYVVNYSVYGVYYVNKGAKYLPEFNDLKENSIDPYTAMKSIYLQSYDNGMNKVLGIKTVSHDNEPDSDKVVLGVLGIDNAANTSDTSNKANPKTTTTASTKNPE